MKKRILSIVLAIAMLATLVPVGIFASAESTAQPAAELTTSETINSVDGLGYVSPTVGADIAESLAGLSVPEGAPYSIDDAYWRNETLGRAERNGTLVAGCAYHLYVRIHVAPGYGFADDIVMQFNGDASLVDTGRSFSGTDYAHLYSVTTQLEGEAPVVDTVNVNGYVAPTVGADIAESLAGLSVPEGAHYSISSAYWYNETLGGRAERNGTFVVGCAYRLRVMICVASGYIFANELVMQFNGDASLVDRDFDYCSSGTDSAYLYSVATQLEGEAPTVYTVNVNGYVAPTAGADIARNLAGLSVPEGAQHSIYNAYWYNETLDRNEKYGTFIAGYAYQLYVKIGGASDYIFSDELVMQFNGDASLVDPDRSSSDTDYAYLYSVTTQLEGELITIDTVNVNGYVAPTAGDYIAESLAGITVPEGAPYSIINPCWYNETLDSFYTDGPFIVGCTYRLVADIYVASGYIFADDLVMQFNGDASLVDPDSSSSGAGDACLYSVATGFEGEIGIIDTVNVNGYVAPTVGADIAESLAGLTAPEDAPYRISVSWYNETLDSFYTDGTFIAGCTYRLRVIISVASGYVLADDIAMRFNGTASLVDHDRSFYSMYYVYLYSDTTRLEGEIPFVDTVNVNGYVAPTVGADIAESLAALTIPEGAPYSIGYVGWYNETLGRTERYGTFIAGCTYHLDVEIDVASGYVFADELVMQFNGDASLVYSDRSSFGDDYASLCSVTTRFEGELITVDTVNVNGYIAPTVGADIAESLAGLTVPEGAHYSIKPYWYNETLDSFHKDGTFVAGCTYRLNVDIYVDSDGIFADDLVMQFNGDASLVDRDFGYCGFEAGYAFLYSVATELPAPAEFFTFASGADTTYVSIDETNGHLVFKAGSKTAADVIALFADTGVSITKANGNAISETAKVGTTCIITSTINGESKSLTVVVVGDLTGDGNVNALDCAKCALHVKSTTPITNPAVLAAANALSNSATINALDINRIGLFIKDKIQNF